MITEKGPKFWDAWSIKLKAFMLNTFIENDHYTLGQLCLFATYFRNLVPFMLVCERMKK